MSVAEFFIRRPVASIVVNLVVVALGVLCFTRLTIREYPNIDQKLLNVELEYAGASVDVMEAQISARVEEVLASVPGVESFQTTITQGMSRTTLEISQSRDLDSAANDVEAKLRRIQPDMPENMRPATITKTDPQAYPSFILALFDESGQRNASELGDDMLRYVKSNLESINGVASVIVQGQTGSPMTYAIDVFMNAQAMTSLNVTPDEVFRAISAQSFVKPAGDINLGPKSYRMTVKAGLTNISDFENVVVREKSGRIIRVKDVAEVKMNDDDARFRIKYNGKTVSLCYVIIQPTANVIETSKQITAKRKEIEQGLPNRNLKLELVSDKSIYINASVHRLQETIIEAIILVAIVILMFLKSFRATIIPILTIPVCLLSGFIIMYFSGFTLNVITLLALLLAVGLVVDDAVVVLEIIVHNIERGMNPVMASIKGMKEIQFSVIGMTLTLASVYLPLSLATGTWGKFFNEFAITLAGMVCMSGVVAFVLAPMMSAKLLKSNQRTYPPVEWFNDRFEELKANYRQMLGLVLYYRWFAIGLASIIAVISLLVAKYGLVNIPEPETDKGTVNLSLSTQRLSLDSVLPVLTAYESIGLDPSVTGVTSYFTAGSDKADIVIILSSNPTQRKSAQEIVKQLNTLDGGRFLEFMPHPYIGGSPLGKSDRFGFTIKTNKSYDELELVRNDMISVLKRMKGYKTKNITMSKTDPEKNYNLKVNRERCFLSGVKLEDVGQVIGYITRGNPPAHRYEREGKQYPVRVWVSEKDRQNPEIVKDFMVRSDRPSENREDRQLVSLRDLIDIEESKVRPQMFHSSGQRSASIFCEFDGDVDLARAYRDFEALALKSLPPGYSIAPTDDIRKLEQESKNIIVIIGLALVFVYLVMAALFESFVDPFIVIMTVPLAISCAILTLKAFPLGSLNAYSYIGLLTVMGLITKHGILLVEFFNIKLKETGSTMKAATESALERFRPIIMTTLAMVLGALPLILKKGSGYEGPRQVGIVLFGGMTFGTIMTIFIVPCLCVIFQQLRGGTNSKKNNS